MKLKFDENYSFDKARAVVAVVLNDDDTFDVVKLINDESISGSLLYGAAVIAGVIGMKENGESREYCTGMAYRAYEEGWE